MNLPATLILTAASVIFAIGCPNGAAAQAEPQSNIQPVFQTAPADSFMLKIPPLQTLIDSAVARSPLIKGQELAIRRNKLDIERQKKSWTKDIVSGGANLNYGRFDNLIIAKDLGLDQLNTNTMAQTRYSVGLSLKFPIMSLFDRYELNSAKIAQEQISVETQMIINQLREEVYTRYNNLVNAYEKYLLLVEDFNDHSITLQNAEKNFLSNRITIEELTLVKMQTSQAKIELTTAKNDFFRARWMLEEITGIPIR